MKSGLLKKMAVRGITSAFISSFINQIVMLIMILASPDRKFVPLVPYYLEHFETPLEAMIVQYFLVGLIGAAFGSFSIFFEIETWSFFKQGILHLVCTCIVWIPIACLIWGLNQYPQAAISTIISFIFTYGLTWCLNYIKCKNNINTINDKLRNRKQKEVS